MADSQQEVDSRHRETGRWRSQPTLSSWASLFAASGSPSLISLPPSPEPLLEQVCKTLPPPAGQPVNGCCVPSNSALPVLTAACQGQGLPRQASGKFCLYPTPSRTLFKILETAHYTLLHPWALLHPALRKPFRDTQGSENRTQTPQTGSQNPVNPAPRELTTSRH